MQFAVACGDVQDCGNVATTPTAAPAAATLLAAAQVAPYNPMYNPLYGMEACGAGYKYRYRTPERTIRHVPAHVPNFRTMSFLFLDQSCRFSPGSAARRTRLMRYRYTSKHVVMSSRLPGSLAFVSRQIPDLPPLKMRGPRAAEYNCTGRSVILGVCPRALPAFCRDDSFHRQSAFRGDFWFRESIAGVSVARYPLPNPCPVCAQPGVRRQRIDSPGSTAEHSWCPWLTGDPAGLGPKICSATGRYIRWTKRSARA